MACQDVGEAVRHGGTRAPEADRPRIADRTLGRAWLIVQADQAPRLLDAVTELSSTGTWKLSPVTEDPDPRSWTSITFPRTHIPAATALLKHAQHVRNPVPAADENSAPPPADTAPDRDYG
ncbi:Uncharacterised protein [Mycobacterium tuberculosis]|nr:Uncharacterised protein [Mycobacterium tuberculosis]